MQKFKVAIARFPASGWEHTACVEWLMHIVVQLKKDPRISDVLSIKPGGHTPITMLRNKAVVDAKASGAQYLLMIDSDMHPDLPYPGAKPFWATAWEWMLDRRDKEFAKSKENLEPYKDEDTITFGGPGRKARAAMAFPPATIAAPYCGPPPDEFCYIFRLVDRETGNPNPDFGLEMISRDMAAISAGIQQVDALPTGLILYDMRVFDVLPPPWFCYEYPDLTQSEKATTEDVYQTRNASMLGLPQYVNWDAWAGHMKTKMVGKPQIIHRDQVHKSLRDAVLRGVDRSDSLIIMDDPPKANGVDSTPAEIIKKLAARFDERDALEAIADDDRI